MGHFSHLPQLVNHYLILNVTLGCVLELWLWFRQGQLTTGSRSQLHSVLALYIQLNNGLINCTHVGCFSHLPWSVNHYLILNVTLGCVLELWLWFRQGQLTTGSSNSDLDNVLVTYSQVESSIQTSSCGFKLLVAIKAILLHCNYHRITFY